MSRTLGEKLIPIDARTNVEIDNALAAIGRSKADGLVISADVLFLANKTKITKAIRRINLPAIAAQREYHADGLLMSYRIELRESKRRSARYV